MKNDDRAQHIIIRILSDKRHVLGVPLTVFIMNSMILTALELLAMNFSSWPPLAFAISFFGFAFFIASHFYMRHFCNGEMKENIIADIKAKQPSSSDE